MIFVSTSLPQSKNLFQKKCLCVSVRRRSQSLNQSTDLVQIRYLGSSSKYLEPFFFGFPLTPKIKGSSHEKKLKILIFSKMAPTILIKFSISMVPLQISLAFYFFRFRYTLKIKCSSHKKNYKFAIFSKMVPTVLMKLLRVYYTFEPQQYGNISFSQKNSCNQNNIFLFYP